MPTTWSPSFPPHFVFASEARSVEGILNASFQSPLSYFFSSLSSFLRLFARSYPFFLHPRGFDRLRTHKVRTRPYTRKSFRVKCTTVYKTKGLNITRRSSEGMGSALSVCLCHSLKLWLELSTWPVLFSWVDQSHQNRHPYDHLLSASCPLWC